MTSVPATQNCRLYLISPDRLDPAIFADELRAALDGGDVAAFQLRLKGVDDPAIARAADTLRPVCQQRGVAFIMNDRPDLAVRLDCDGVRKELLQNRVHRTDDLFGFIVHAVPQRQAYQPPGYVLGVVKRT
jgi:Thiamine monophosphate synthase